MPFPATMGVYEYPVGSGKNRVFYQGSVTGLTNGAFVCLPSISASNSFVLTKLDFMVHTGAATVGTLYLKDSIVTQIYCGAALSVNLDFQPNGIRSNVSNTGTVYLIMGGGAASTVGCSIIAVGYFD